MRARLRNSHLPGVHLLWVNVWVGWSRFLLGRAQLTAMSYQVVRKDVQVQIPVVENVSCDRCGTAFTTADRAYPDNTGLEFRDALVVSLSGGYAMFIDPEPIPHAGSAFPDPMWDKVLCHTCAHELCDWFGMDVSAEHSCP